MQQKNLNKALSRSVKIKLSSAAERMVKKRHPWVFAEQIISELPEGVSTGQLAVVYNEKNKFLAAGFLDLESPIRFRLFVFYKPEKVDEIWMKTRILESIKSRDIGRFESFKTNGIRYCYGENDGLPGLVIDRYESIAVVKIYSAIWVPFLDCVFDVLMELAEIGAVVFRASNHAAKNIGTALPFSDGAVVRGDVPEDGKVWFQEHEIWFEAAVCNGQKTGFFLDQRENRQRVREGSFGKSVLNLFSFNGGFSMAALVGGARRVCDVDISAAALDSAQVNFEKNRAQGLIKKQTQYETVKADIFDWLKENPNEFYDWVIVDPPALAKNKKEVERAKSAYRWLIKQSLSFVGPKGILLAASCTAHLRADDYFRLVIDVVKASGRRWKILEKHHHASDHQASLQEMNYLKAIYIQLDV